MGQFDSGSSKKLVMVRILNIITSCVLIGFGIGGIIFMAINSLFSAKFFLIFSPIFMILFGIMLLAAECKFRFLFDTFGFLASMIGRGIFNLYLASQVFFYFSCGPNASDVLAWISAVVIFVLGFVYIIMQFCAGKGL